MMVDNNSILPLFLLTVHINGYSISWSLSVMLDDLVYLISSDIWVGITWNAVIGVSPNLAINNCCTFFITLVLHNLYSRLE